MNSSERLIFWSLCVLMPVAFLLACATGAVKIPFGTFFDAFSGTGNGFSEQQVAVLYHIRLPRVLLSSLVGGVLALCGVALQGLFRNPLADPAVIGISAGAALSASLFIVVVQALLTWNASLAGVSALSLFTFAGATLASVSIYKIARKNGITHVPTMLLAGIAINALASAGTGLLAFMADDAQLRSLTFWTLGSIGGATWSHVVIMTIILAFSCGLLFSHRKSYNALALGEKEALSLGIPMQQLTRRTIVVTSLAVGCSVAFCGMIAFVGLVVPHILRLAGSPNYRFLLLASVPGGALMLVLTDLLARTIAAPAEIPIGILTSLAGAPVFLYLLIRQQRLQH